MHTNHNAFVRYEISCLLGVLADIQCIYIEMVHSRNWNLHKNRLYNKTSARPICDRCDKRAIYATYIVVTPSKL